MVRQCAVALSQARCSHLLRTQSRIELKFSKAAAVHVLGTKRVKSHRSDPRFPTFREAHKTVEERKGYEKQSFPPLKHSDLDPDAKNFQCTADAKWPIRLLTILPATARKPMVCELENTTIASCRDSYEAISYSPIKEATRDVIIVNGQEVLVTEDVRNLLQCLRSTQKPRKVWIDALCFDQADQLEQSLHAANRGLIFEGATKVIVHLGVKTHRMLASGSFLALEKLALLEKGDHDAIELLLGGYKFPVTHWQALVDLVRRPWWHRAKSVQEYAMARNVAFRIGSFDFDPETLTKGMNNLFDYHEKGAVPFGARALVDELADEGLQALLAARTIYQSQKQLTRLRFIDCLSTFRSFKTSDARDKVFSYFNLLAPSQDFPAPDFSKDVLTTYLETAKAIIQSTGNLELLSHNNGQKLPNINVPSWCPDWTVTVDERRTPLWPNGYSACGRFTSAEPVFDTNLKTMTLRGVFLGKVVRNRRVEKLTGDKDKEALLNQLQGFIRARLFADTYGTKSAPKPKDPMPLLDAMYKTFIAARVRPNGEQGPNNNHNNNSNNNTSPVEPSSLEARRLWLAWANQPASTVPLPEANPDAELYQAAIRRALRGRRLINTSRGYFGMADGGPQVGDEIFVLEGGLVPFCLRRKVEEGTTAAIAATEIKANDTRDKTARGKSVEGKKEVARPVDEMPGRYTLVGECYLHGFMNGEGVEKIKNKDSMRKIILE